MSKLRFARGVPMAGLLAASLAALPSLDWCPLAAWDVAACETSATCDAASAGCAASAALPCDREPDPLPFGDNVWCIRPPVIALTASTVELPQPRPSSPVADLVPTLDLAPPAPLERARFGPRPGPVTPREPHGPPQPRAPPVG